MLLEKRVRPFKKKVVCFLDGGRHKNQPLLGTKITDVFRKISDISGKISDGLFKIES